MAEQLRCRPGDLAVIVPPRGFTSDHDDEQRYIGAFVTCLRYVGYHVEPQLGLPGGSFLIELHCVARAWEVSSPAFPGGLAMVSDDCLRPIRGDGSDEDVQKRRERDAPIAA